VFAHNGLVPEIVEIERGNRSAVCRPEGETDSEYAFCHLLGEIARHFGIASAHDAGSWLETLAAVSELIASSGKFNFLLSDGEYLIAYGHDRLHHTERSLRRSSAAAELDLVMIATEPLTAHDSWRAFRPGELRVYRAARLAGQLQTRPRRASVRASALPAIGSTNAR
jgi:glutamine amidotransferase